MEKALIATASFCIFLAVLVGHGGGSSSPPCVGPGTSMDLLSKNMVNEAAYIPAACYTKTEVEGGKSHNPCYTCHAPSSEPNYINDSDLQMEYSFPAYATTNRWTNLFKTETDAKATTAGDSEILDYVRTNNYCNPEGAIYVRDVLKMVPKGWDFNGNGRWDGFTPDCYFNFDTDGFDRAPNGDYTGWRAFAYYPFPGTHWPTNGSSSDALIRLGEDFRKDRAGQFDLTAYQINLAIVEALIKRRDVPIQPVDEKRYGVDLDKNGAIGIADIIKYDWAPLQGKNMSFVGMAGQHQQDGTVHLAAGLFPEKTEFLQSLRYLDVTDSGEVKAAPRVKELRYSRKLSWRNYPELHQAAHAKVKEKRDFPDRLEEFYGDVERGVSNAQGWVYQGFIEDSEGQLRPQTYEETVYCMGCHGALGATTDGIFSFSRKFDADAVSGGWHHWSQRDLKGVKEPKATIKGAGTQYEYSFYLIYNKAGDELRNNTEVLAKFFNADGTVKADMLAQLHDDITLLLFPSKERALKLNKAYQAIVEEQSYIHGREVVVKPVTTVHQNVNQNQSTKVKTAVVTQIGGTEFNPERTVPYGGAEMPPSDPTLKADVEGEGMEGPDGKSYEVSKDGLIYKSRYGLDVDGFFFPFPDRLTLPTRVIVPNSSISACYTCHRISYPVPPANIAGRPMVSLPSPATDAMEKGKAKRLTASQGADINGRWSPDGSRIAWISQTADGYQLWLMNSDGSGTIPLTAGGGVQGWPEWSPDSTRIVYLHYSAATGQYAVRTVRTDGTGTDTIVESSNPLDTPAWRPDGQHIVYAAENNGNWDIWAARSDGSASLRLTTSPDMETNPHWSPDGSKLTYKVAPATGKYTLTEQHLLTFEKGMASPTVHLWEGPQSIQMSDWNPDGTRFAYTAEAVSGASGRDRISYVAAVSDISVGGGKVAASRDTIISRGMTLGDRGAVFSPNGRQIAFWGWDKSYTATLWLYDTDTATIRQLTTNGFDFYPRWSPDGKKILFESNRSGNLDLWVMDVD